jgi:hypothetical protein
MLIAISYFIYWSRLQHNNAQLKNTITFHKIISNIVTVPVSFKELLMNLFMQLKVKLALEYFTTHSAGMLLRALTQTRIQVTFHILFFNKSLLALGTLEHLPEGEGYVGDAVALCLVNCGPGLYVRAQGALVHLAATLTLALHANCDNLCF